jgi:2-methylisocitrate lyase-like PEP mutase family enzyme
MALTQTDKAEQFRALHEAPDAFVIANVWDGGSARMMAGLGFAALATSSGASAGLLGRRDGKVTRDEALAQARVICDATDLPSLPIWRRVSETHRRLSRRPSGWRRKPGSSAARSRTRAAARTRRSSAVAAARAVPFPFTSTGRAENFLRGRPDLDDTIKRMRRQERRH